MCNVKLEFEMAKWYIIYIVAVFTVNLVIPITLSVSAAAAATDPENHPDEDVTLRKRREFVMCVSKKESELASQRGNFY